MNIATQMMLNAAGQPGDAVGKIEANRQQVLKRTEELAQYALKMLDSDPKAHTDTGLTTVRNLYGSFRDCFPGCDFGLGLRC